jgi:hypothetical protein
VYLDILGTFRNSKWSRIFLAWIFLHEKQPDDKKYERGAPGPKGDQVAQALRPGHATMVCVVLGPLMPSVFAPDCSAWPKNSYIKTSRGSLKEAEQSLFQQRLEGKTLPESLPVTSPTSPTSPIPPPWWRGSSPPLYYGFVALACSISLLCHDV